MARPEPKATRTSLLRAQVSRERRAKEQIKPAKPPFKKRQPLKRSFTCVSTCIVELKPKPKLLILSNFKVLNLRRRPKVIQRCLHRRQRRPLTNCHNHRPPINKSLNKKERNEPLDHKTPLASIITPVRVPYINRLTPAAAAPAGAATAIQRSSIHSPSGRNIWSSRRGSDQTTSRRHNNNNNRVLLSTSRPFDRYRHLDLWRALRRGSPEGITRAINVGQADPNEYFTIPGNWVLPWQFIAPVILSLLNPTSGLISDLTEAVSLGAAAARLASLPIGQLLGHSYTPKFLQMHPTHGSILFAGRKELSTLINLGSSVDALDWAGRSALHVLLETPPRPPCNVAGCFNYHPDDTSPWAFGGPELIVNRGDSQCFCCAAFLASFLYEVELLNYKNSLSLGQTLLATHICLSHQDGAKRTPVDLAAQWVRQQRIWRNVTDYVWSYLPPEAQTRVLTAVPKELCDLTFVAEDRLRLKALRPLVGISFGLDEPEKLFNLDGYLDPPQPDDQHSPAVHTPFLATIDENLAGPILFAASPPISGIRNRGSLEPDSLTPVPVGRVAHLPAPAGTARLAFFRPEDNQTSQNPDETVAEFIKFAKENLHHQALTGVWEFLGAQVGFSNNEFPSDKLN